MTTYARVIETFEYEVPVRDGGDEAEAAGDRIADFGPDADDVRERAPEFGCELVDHRITVAGLTHHD